MTMMFKKSDIVVPNDFDYVPSDLRALGLTPGKKYEVLDAYEDKASTGGSGYSVDIVNDRGQKWIYDQNMFWMSKRGT